MLSFNLYNLLRIMFETITTIIYPKNTNNTNSFLTLKIKIKLKIAVGSKYLISFIIDLTYFHNVAVRNTIPRLPLIGKIYFKCAAAAYQNQQRYSEQKHRSRYYDYPQQPQSFLIFIHYLYFPFIFSILKRCLFQSAVFPIFSHMINDHSIIPHSEAFVKIPANTNLLLINAEMLLLFDTMCGII